MEHIAPIERLLLENGLEVIAIADHRAPVVTHMVYYKNGSADDPLGKSGIAHFLEHLMFKGTNKNPKGVFSEIVAGLGGQENAFTSYDFTAYFQRVAREHLPKMMELEADRMKGLVLQEKEVLSERKVVEEERKMRTDSHPNAQLQESLAASLYVHHPYGIPVIGWAHEIETLSREDALSYYKRFYRPDNAILIIAGDIRSDEVFALARQIYGAIPKEIEPLNPRNRVKEPTINATRFVKLADAKVDQPLTQRFCIVPTHSTSLGNEAFALEVLGHILGGGKTSRLYKNLVLDSKKAVLAYSWYWSDALDIGQFGIYAVPSDGTSLEFLDIEIEKIVTRLREEKVTPEELKRTKTRLIADMIYAQDSQSHLARIYGSTLCNGGKIEDIREWSGRIEEVTAEDVISVASSYLLPKRSVTGHLMNDSVS